ncbi:MAG: hypothetical protein FJ217_11715 [Ignavibacteria bacterium]|nr:hypothetical protein [Ignavibacteria bacterium]
MFSAHSTLSTPHDFDFWRTVYSHGWCALPPFWVDKVRGALSRLLLLEDGSLASCTLSDGKGRLSVQIQSTAKLDKVRKDEIKRQLVECLRLGEDLSAFYAAAKRHPRYRWIPASGAGRLLRAPTVFEDAVKMICTTNCSWSLTEIMVANLIASVGKKFADGLRAFPTPEATAGLSDSFVRKHVRAGYRSPYIIELAERVASGKLDIESWRRSALPTDELFRLVRSVKGIGDYAAGNLLKLLGRYDYLGLDSWVRARFYELHKNGRRVADKTIERHYSRFGKWRGLFFWMEMTRRWADQKFPF